MGQHHWREDRPVAVATVGRHATPEPALSVGAPRLVPHDAPPAGLGYPPPTSYRPHPITGVPTPPAAAPAVPPGGALGSVHHARGAGRSSARRPARISTRVPLTVAVAGAAVALIGTGSQLPGLVDAVTTTAASAPVAATPTSSNTPTDSAVVQQCATVVADALDDTVAALGRTPSTQWSALLAARGDSLAATYGETSREHRAYELGADDILTWLRADSAEDYGTVTTRVAGTVATACSA
jgi:hypothetical protein